MLIGHGAIQKDFQALVREGRLGHGYIFHGQPRGGKYPFAVSLARELEQGAFAPEKEGAPPLSDLMIIGPDEGRTIGIDRVREVRHFLAQRPNVSPRRTLIIRDAERLTDEAQNALLKVAEEPSASALIILTLDDPEKLRPTLRSRFQPVHFSGVPTKEIAAWLNQVHKVTATESAALANAAHGAPGLAWAMKFDETFRARLESARDFLGNPPARSTLLKTLLEDEEFRLEDFLEAVMVAAAERPLRDPRLWHALFDLRRQASESNLNPRLQLTALVRHLS
jgi:DNA polymerase III subunit delta'